MADSKKPKTKAAANSNTAALAVGPSVSAPAPARGAASKAMAAEAKPAARRSAPKTETKATPTAETKAKTAPHAETKAELQAAHPGDTAHQIGPDEKAAMIARAAYFRAEARHFAPGYEHEDWLAAEREIEELLSAHHRA